jgi:PhzF family phenazine biosynthesis protein
MLASADAVLAVDPVKAHDSVIDLGVVGFYPTGHASGAAYEIRAFFSDPFGGLVEDPVCGSLNASVAQWLLGEGRVVAPYQVTQGRRLARDGRIAVQQDETGQVWIGGATSTRFAGTASLAD